MRWWTPKELEEQPKRLSKTARRSLSCLSSIQLTRDSRLERRSSKARKMAVPPSTTSLTKEEAHLEFLA
jgi:hypothetical protein